ncbi:MAG: pyrroline-5-carboxylate reductase [Proteobacteria bacterium]|nr:pyrroline-5-carboxylate reductase [Pseudomonadota bacterium]MBU1738523.1 pyrroline-5-carboxylate reductase [Pseudomonadota bacterium]
MKIEGKICFLGGGMMAEALISGILKAGLVTAAQIVAVDLAPERRQVLADKFGIEVSDQASAVTGCGIVILAVKPQVVNGLLTANKGLFTSDHLVISIAAGVSIDILESCLEGRSCRVVRVMPNTPALVMEGASALCGGTLAGEDDLQTARLLFDAVGRSVVLTEKDMDAVTGLSGSGPAYVFSFIEGLIDAGVKVGLARPVAVTLTLQTVLGATRLAMETGEHPAQLRAMVTSPGGTTIAGLRELEKAGLGGILMDAVEAATNRSRELGRQAQEK